MVTVLTLALWMIAESLASRPPFQTIAPYVRLIPLVGLGITMAMLFGITYDLWQWQRGHGLNCTACHGMLGCERKGRFGAYRKCLACSKNVNCKIY